MIESIFLSKSFSFSTKRKLSILWNFSFLSESSNSTLLILLSEKNSLRSKLVHQCAVSTAIMIPSIVNSTAPEYLTSLFVRRCHLSSYNLRENEYKLAVPQPRTQFYKRSLSYSGSVLWNGLPLEVRQLTSPSIFKGKLRDINFD